MFHTPNLASKNLYIAPVANNAPQWGAQTIFYPDGNVRFARDVQVYNRVLIGGSTFTSTSSPSLVGNMALAVEGNIGARAIYVRSGNWPDYVFRPGYRLRPLAEVGRYVGLHHHLPGIPSAATVQARGQDLGQMNALLLQKVEELTLYLLALQQENQALQQRVSRLEK